MHDVQISYLQDDYRPPFILDDVKGAILYDIQAKKSSGVSSFILKNVEDIHVSQTNNVKDIIVEKADRKEL